MPRAPKHKDDRSNTERRDVGEVPADELEASVPVPSPRRGWLAVTKASWDRYWRSPARHLTIVSLDIDALERLWGLYDEREQAYRKLRKARVVIGSTGQERQSGFYTVISRLDAEIRQLEDRVGKSVKSRLTLGMRVKGDANPGQQSDSADRRSDRVDDDEPADDPRIYHLDRRAG